MLELLIVLVAVYLFAIRCRGGNPGFEKFRGWGYAHRGLHGDGVPENSMEAFRLALEGGYGIMPRWADAVRKGKMRCYVYLTLMKVC